MTPFSRRGSTRPVDVLVVCTGNVCRSPYIAAVLRDRHPGLTVVSAGTAALVGQPPTPEVVAALARRGIVPGNGVAQQLSRRLVRDARLVLTATRAHRASVLAHDPGATGRTFTIKELSRSVSGVDPGDGLTTVLTRLVDRLSAERVDHDDDLDDPYGLGAAAYARMTREVDEALTAIDPLLSTVGA